MHEGGRCISNDLNVGRFGDRNRGSALTMFNAMSVPAVLYGAKTWKGASPGRRQITEITRTRPTVRRSSIAPSAAISWCLVGAHGHRLVADFLSAATTG